MKFNVKFLFLILIVLLNSCSSNDDLEVLSEVDETSEPFNDLDFDILNSTLNLPADLYQYNVDLPNFFLDNDLQEQDNTPNNNPVTNIGATLGRVLFYDDKAFPEQYYFMRFLPCTRRWIFRP